MKQDFCETCDDGSGSSVFPFYGVAPHTHVGERMIGSTRIEPKERWPENFREDPEVPGCGVYLYCPKCGAGDKQ